MIYLHHDFYSNFSASLKSGDLDISSDLLVNEISDFIVYDTKTIVDALKKAGIKSSESQSDEELVDSIIENLGTNKNLSKALAFIIANANELINNGKGTKSDWAKTIDTIAQGIYSVGSKIDTNKIAFKEDILQHITTKAESKGDYKRTILIKDKTSNVGWYILGGIAFIAGIIFIISKVQKRSLNTVTASLEAPPAAQMAQGGVVPLIPPSPPIPVVPTMGQPMNSIPAAQTQIGAPAAPIVPITNGI